MLWDQFYEGGPPFTLGQLIELRRDWGITGLSNRRVIRVRVQRIVFFHGISIF